MAWVLDQNTPIYIQIMEEVIKRIITGIYPPGSQIPSVRLLALEAGVNPNTMQKALTELERSGILNARRTSGRFVTTDAELIKEQRLNLAKSQTLNYLNNMKGLGLTKDEIIKLLNEENI